MENYCASVSDVSDFYVTDDDVFNPVSTLPSVSVFNFGSYVFVVVSDITVFYVFWKVSISVVSDFISMTSAYILTFSDFSVTSFFLCSLLFMFFGGCGLYVFASFGVVL